MILQESVFIPWLGGEPGEKLHVRRIFPASERLRAPVLMIHGAVENGRIFYTASGKGIAPFLAEHGFDVFAADLRGRGLSEPSISRQSRYGQLEAITQEIPAFIEMIRQRRGVDTPQLWLAHSWGGVLLLSVLARFPEYREVVKGIVFFGTKRTVQVSNWEKRLKIDFFWHRAARAMVALHGYLPAARYRMGADSETDLSHLESKSWVLPGPWIDPRDGFDYGAALANAELPPLYFLAGKSDRSLGHPQDVRALIRELGPHEVEFRLLGRATGNRHDYGHIDMLTHPDARSDHFLEVLKWMREQSR